jgi:uncharacterized protein YlzI (FlbEa/FlbD family)
MMVLESVDEVVASVIEYRRQIRQGAFPERNADA